MTGLEAGHLLCQGVGADHVCDYEELLVARTAGEFSTVAQGTTAWVHRTTSAMVNAQVSFPGSGGRCVDWIFNGNHIADGEYATFDQAGVITFHLDPDTVYDPGAPGQHTVAGDLECGGVMRSIFCCNAACP